MAKIQAHWCNRNSDKDTTQRRKIQPFSQDAHSLVCDPEKKTITIQGEEMLEKDIYMKENWKITRALLGVLNPESVMKNT